MRRNLTSILVGTLILFVWNALSWMVLPFHGNSLKSIPESAINGARLQENMPEDGVYHFPGFGQDMGATEMQRLEKRLSKGPRITLMVYKAGPTRLFDPATFLTNFLFNLIAVTGLFIITSRLAKKSFSHILTTLLLLALAVSFMSDFPQMNWYLFPLSYTMTNVLDHIISMGLLGLFFYAYSFKSRSTE